MFNGTCVCTRFHRQQIDCSSSSRSSSSSSSTVDIVYHMVDQLLKSCERTKFECDVCEIEKQKNHVRLKVSQFHLSFKDGTLENSSHLTVCMGKTVLNKLTHSPMSRLCKFFHRFLHQQQFIECDDITPLYRSPSSPDARVKWKTHLTFPPSLESSLSRAAGDNEEDMNNVLSLLA